jgi:hypothetical protein
LLAFNISTANNKRIEFLDMDDLNNGSVWLWWWMSLRSV